MPRPRIAAAAALALLSVAALAQVPAKPGAPDRSRVTAGTYSADSAHTLIGWRVDHLGFNDYFGLFGDVTGTLRLDPAKPAEAKLEVTIPINPVVASAGLRDHLMRPGKDGKPADFFGVDPAPARFVSTQVLPSVDGMGAYIMGSLTLNGRTAPVAIQARFSGAGAAPRGGAETVGFSGRAVLRRSDFGIAYGIPMVSDEVELDISAAFEKAPPEEPQRRPPLAADACNAKAIAPWIGKKATAAARAEVAEATGAGSIRWLYPDSIVTQDYRPNRLNVTIAKWTDVVVSARCG